MKKLWLVALLLAVPAMSQSKDDNKPLPQDTQIKLLKTQRQLQQIQVQINGLERQYKEAVKQSTDLQTEMNSDCATAAKTANVDLSKFTCDLDSLTFAPRPEPKTPDTGKPVAAK